MIASVMPTEWADERPSLSICQTPIGYLESWTPVDVEPVESKPSKTAAESQPTAAAQPAWPDAGQILSDAHAAVCGPRQTDHGRKAESFEAIATMWTAYLACRREGPESPIRPADVAQMMILLKLCRAEWGRPLPDHALDAAGYAAIAGELWGLDQ